MVSLFHAHKSPASPVLGSVFELQKRLRMQVSPLHQMPQLTDFLAKRHLSFPIFQVKTMMSIAQKAITGSTGKKISICNQQVYGIYLGVGSPRSTSAPLSSPLCMCSPQIPASWLELSLPVSPPPSLCLSVALSLT